MYNAARLGKELVARIVASGFPEPLPRTTAVRRRAWYDSYVDTLIHRDIRDLSHIQHRDIIPKLLRLLANHTRQLLNVSELAKAFQLSRQTIDCYVELLRQVFFSGFPVALV